MARAPSPHWHKARSRWYAAIGERDERGKARYVYAPAGIGRRDVTEALAWFAREVEARRQEVHVTPAGEVTVEGLAELYVQAVEGRAGQGDVSPDHYVKLRSKLGRFVDATIGGRRCGDRRAALVTTGELQAWVGELAKVHRPHYVAGLARAVSALFNWACRATPDRGPLLERNPMEGVTVPVVPRSVERFASTRATAAFLWYWWRRAGSHDQAVRRRYDRLTVKLVRAIAQTGARPKELCSLRWEDIRWEAGRTPEGHAYATGTLPADRWKAGRKKRAERVIFFSPGMTRSLRREFDRPDRHPVYVFVHGRGRGGIGGGEPWTDGSVLGAKVRRVRREAVAAQRALAARVKAGESPPLGLNGLGLEPIPDEGEGRLVNYTLRHTAASLLLMEGVDVPTIAAMMGTSPEMIHGTYGHLLADHLASAAGKLAGARRGRRTG